MSSSEEKKLLLSKSYDDIYNISDENSNYKYQNGSNFSRFHRYPFSGSSFNTNVYGLIPNKLNNYNNLKVFSSCYSVLTGNYDNDLDFPEIPSGDELTIPIIENDEINENDENSEDDSPADNDRKLIIHKMYISESKILVKYSIPIIISEVLRNSLLLMPVIFIGHRSAFELAAITLGHSFCSVTGWSLLIGLDSTLDTFCSQAYAAAKTVEDKKLVGKILQRGFVILVCFCFCIMTLWEFTEPLLLLCRQDAGVAEIAGRFTKYERLGLIPYVLFECEKKLFQIQGLMFVPMFIILIALPINALIHYFFIFSSWSPLPSEIAYIGSPFATAITFTIMSILGILYIKYIKGKECWGGIDLKCIFNLRLWKEFLKLGIPSAFMLGNEWWAYEVCSLFAGLLGDKPLAIQSVFSSITNYCYNIPMGLSMATTLRIGNNLGERNSVKAKATSRISIIMSFIVGTINSTLLLLFRYKLPKIFTNSHKIVKGCSQILIIGAIYQLSDGIATVGNGVLRGSGHQNIGAGINFVGYWIIGIPFSVIFCFVFNWNLNGIWSGMALALFIVSALELITICRMDWDEEVQIAAERIRKN